MTKKALVRKKFLVALAAVLVCTPAVILGAVYLFNVITSDAPAGYSKIANYNHIEEGMASCLALMPECGLCIGKVIDKQCYVKKSELTEEELGYMGLR